MTTEYNGRCTKLRKKHLHPDWFKCDEERKRWYINPDLDDIRKINLPCSIKSKHIRDPSYQCNPMTGMYRKREKAIRTLREGAPKKPKSAYMYFAASIPKAGKVTDQLGRVVSDFMPVIGYFEGLAGEVQKSQPELAAQIMQELANYKTNTRFKLLGLIWRSQYGQETLKPLYSQKSAVDKAQYDVAVQQFTAANPGMKSLYTTTYKKRVEPKTKAQAQPQEQGQVPVAGVKPKRKLSTLNRWASLRSVSVPKGRHVKGYALEWNLMKGFTDISGEERTVDSMIEGVVNSLNIIDASSITPEIRNNWSDQNGYWDEITKYFINNNFTYNADKVNLSLDDMAEVTGNPDMYPDFATIEKRLRTQAAQTLPAAQTPSAAPAALEGEQSESSSPLPPPVEVLSGASLLPPAGSPPKSAVPPPPAQYGGNRRYRRMY